MARTPAKNGKPSEPMATTLLLPPNKTLTDLIKTRGDAKKKQQSATGTIGNAVKAAVEDKHLDRKAWSIAGQLHDLDDEQLHVTYFHLLHYIEVLGVTKRATAQEEMFRAGETGPSPGGYDDEDGDETSAAKRIGTAARKVAEAAGATLPSD